jgi:hypothetical protein
LPIRCAPSYLKLLLCALGVAVMLLGVPGVASAEVFVVNTEADGEELPATCGAGADEPCVTLRSAIQAASRNGEPDTITFEGLPAGSVLEVEEGTSLPEIFDPVTIDGYAVEGGPTAAPGIELIAEEPSESSTGLDVRSGTGTRIEGLAIGGFEVGIQLGMTEGPPPLESQICGNYIGVGVDGGTPIPNRLGVEVGGGVGGTKIGDGGACAGNVISGNEEDGVYDNGLETTIAGNRIGIGAAGAILPNGSGPGSAAVFEAAGAEDTMVGGTGPTGAAANLIWFNHGPGVFVEGSDGEVSIRHDSFLENEGKGIEAPELDLPAPTITKAESEAPHELIVEGTLIGTTPGETVELDFYGTGTCDPSGAGEGQTYLGSGKLEGVAIGSNQYAYELPVEVPEGETAITATSTRAAGATTEFSTCQAYLPPAPGPEKHETQASSNPPTGTLTASVIPINGKKVIVKPEAGKVLIKLPGSKKFVPLKELKEIPVGAVIDATKGRVLLTSIDPDGTQQSAEFFGGVFRVKQRDGAGLVVLELLDTVACPATGSVLRGTFASASSARPARAGSKLWGSGHGSFRTEGNNGSATVRGTIWLVEDRCDGTTFFKTRRGVVSVRDFVAHKTLPLPAGKTYLAGGG